MYFVLCSYPYNIPDKSSDSTNEIFVTYKQSGWYVHNIVTYIGNNVILFTTCIFYSSKTIFKLVFWNLVGTIGALKRLFFLREFFFNFGTFESAPLSRKIVFGPRKTQMTAERFIKITLRWRAKNCADGKQYAAEILFFVRSSPIWKRTRNFAADADLCSDEQ